MAPSEHRRSTPPATWMAVMVFVLLPVAGVTGIIAALSRSFSGALKWWESALIVGLGSVISGVFAFLLARFVRRILSVKTIRLCEGGTIEITTIKGGKFSAKLPEDVTHVVVAEDGLSVTLKVANRYFVVDSSEFTDRNRVKEFLYDCLKKTPVIGTLRLGGMHWIRRLFRDRQRDKAMTWARGHYEEPLQVAAGEVGYWIHVLLDYPYNTFVPKSHLREDLALEPAELLQVSLALGEKGDILLTPEQTAKCETIDDLVRLVQNQMVNARIVGA